MRPLRNESGGIEGMPLQLMITVIVAGLVLAVVLGWTLSIQSPAVIKSVSTDPASVNVSPLDVDKPASKTLTIKVTAYDAKNAPIPDTVVTMGGAVAQAIVRHAGSDGMATFSAVVATLPPGVTVGELTLTIQKAGYPSKTWTIPVTRGA